MIRNAWSIPLLLLLTVVANAQVVKCTYNSTYHETDDYTCEDKYSRKYTRENLLKEPHPHEVLYSCWHNTIQKPEKHLYIDKPSTLCNEALSNKKKQDLQREKKWIREKVSTALSQYLDNTISYYQNKDSLNLSWFKSGNSSESYYDFKGHLYTPSGSAWYWKDKEVYIFKMWLKEPAKGHGITIEIKGDMPNTGCKDGTTLTFLINDDYRIIFPPEMNKYPCFDSVAINGLYLRSEFSNYDPMLIKNGDNILKETIEKIDVEKKEIAEREAEKDNFKKAWNEAKKESSGEFIEHSIKICTDRSRRTGEECSTSLSDISSGTKNFFYNAEGFSSEIFDMGTIDLSDVKNKKLEFTIVMNWEELNNWKDKNYWNEEKWGSKDMYGECKEKIGKINIEAGFASIKNDGQYHKEVSLPIDDYLVENENSHPWIKKVSIPLEDFRNKINDSFNWNHVESVFIKVASVYDCNGFRSRLLSILEENFYDITNVVIINTAPAKKILDTDPATCSSKDKGTFKNGLINANNTYICSDSGWSLYSVKIGNIEVAARNLDVGGTTFTYDNMYFEEKNQIEAWNRYSRTWGHIYRKSDLQNVCPDGWRLPNESDLKEIKNQISSKQTIYPYINYSYESNADEYGCIDMFGNKVRRDTSLCEMATSIISFSNNTSIILDGERSGYQYTHPNLYWAMGKNGEAFVYGVNDFKKRENLTSNANFIRCVKNTDDNIVSKEPSSENIAQRKERLKNQKQESASAAAESAKQDDNEKSSISTTKLLRIAVFSAVAVGGAAAAYMFDKKAKDATATPPTNEQEFKKGHDDAKQNQNVRNISLGVAAAGLVALGISILF